MLLINAISVIGQTQAKVKKIHFIVHTDNPSDNIAKYEKAINNYELDQFRFYSTRRTIRFQNSTVWVELYSAKELLDLYNKTISPVTIKDGQKYKEVEFALTMDGENIKPQPK